MRHRILAFCVVIIAVTGCGSVESTTGGAGGSGGAGGAGGTGGSGGADFGISLTPTAVFVRENISRVVTVDVQRQGSFNGDVTVTVTGMPSGVVAAPLLIPMGNTSGGLSLSVTAGTPQGGPHTVMVTGTSANLTHSAPLDVTVAGAPGSLDQTFGTGGFTTTQVSGTTFANAMALQPDGKIIVGGQAASQMIAIRLNTDGMLDSTFGSGGKSSVGIGSGAGVSGLAVQSDGKILMGGFGKPQTTEDFALVRLTPTGGLDSGFGTGGTVTTDLGATDEGQSVLIQTDGKIVLTGSTFGASSAFAATRYTSDGGLDTSFGTGGKVTTSVGGSSGYGGHGILQPDGMIVSGGSTSADFGVVRYTASGATDSAFGSGGVVTTDIAGQNDGVAEMLLPGGGKILAVGFAAQTCNGTCAALVRYNANGSLDLTFGTGGKVRSTFTLFPWAAALDSSGKIIAVGSSGSSFAAGRFNADGSVDSAFGGTGGNAPGLSTINLGGSSGQANAVAVQADGRIVVVGVSSSGTTQSATIVRLWP